SLIRSDSRSRDTISVDYRLVIPLGVRKLNPRSDNPIGEVSWPTPALQTHDNRHQPHKKPNFRQTTPLHPEYFFHFSLSLSAIFQANFP
ncbi:MAG: hypothetical protein AAB453_00875, partial [Patescibacteria group bacterium]